MDLSLTSLFDQPFTKKLIAAAARDLVGKAGLSSADLADLEQELRAALVEQFPRYDAARGKGTTFVRLVTESTARSILRHRQAAKRGGCRAVPLARAGCRTDVRDSPNDPVESTAHERRLGVMKAGPEDMAGLRVDVSPVVAALPARLRELADRLTRQTVSEVARDLGLPRSTIASRVKQIRRRFEQAGLGKYSPRVSSFRNGTA